MDYGSSFCNKQLNEATLIHYFLESVHLLVHLLPKCVLPVLFYLCVWFAVCLVVRTGFWVISSVLLLCHLQLRIDQLSGTPTHPHHAPHPSIQPAPTSRIPSLCAGCINQVNRTRLVPPFLSCEWRSHAFGIRMLNIQQVHIKFTNHKTRFCQTNCLCSLVLL